MLPDQSVNHVPGCSDPARACRKSHHDHAVISMAATVVIANIGLLATDVPSATSRATCASTSRKYNTPESKRYARMLTLSDVIEWPTNLPVMAEWVRDTPQQPAISLVHAEDALSARLQRTCDHVMRSRHYKDEADR